MPDHSTWEIVPRYAAAGKANMRLSNMPQHGLLIR